MTDSPISPGETGGGRRRVRRTAAAPALLPSARAALGALLCALAALLTFTAYQNANKPPKTKYLVASGPLSPGQALALDDMELAAMEVPIDFRTRLFTNPERLVGVNVVGPVEKGELLQLGNLILKGEPEKDELSFSISTTDAANGRIQPGERIRIYDRTESGAQLLGETAVVAIQRFDDGSMVYTIVPDPSLDADRLINATTNGKLYVVRITGSKKTQDAASDTSAKTKGKTKSNAAPRTNADTTQGTESDTAASPA